MVKPQLPREIALKFPSELVHIIQSFVPHSPKVSPKSSPSWSPSFDKELRRIQTKGLKGKHGTYMMELDDFLLDRHDDYDGN